MRVALVTNAYPPQMRGGAGRMCLWHEEMLLAAGHEVKVFHPEITWWNASIMTRLMYHLRDLWGSRLLAEDVISFKPDVLITENLTGCGFSTPRLVLQQAAIPWIHVLHDVQLFEPSGRLKQEQVTYWQRLWSWLRRLVFDHPTVFVSPTQWLIDQHRLRGFCLTEESIILPNPAPEEQFVLRASQTPLTALLVSPTPEKGIAMAAQLVSEVEGLRLIATYPEGQEILPITQKNIEYRANTGPLDVLQYMKEADVLLVPSTVAENQPTVIFEAASVGLPVIASRIGGIPEVVGSAVLLADPLDVSAWKRHLLTLQDSSRYSQKALEMYELARAHSVKEYQSRFVELVESIADTSKR